MNDFTTTITIAGTPAAIYEAILEPRAWWNSSIAETPTRVNDEFGFDIPSLHRTRMRITRAVPGRSVVWHVVDNRFGFVDDQTEWIGHDLSFDLEPTDDGTRLTFTQRGLTPELECYDICSKAWSFFVGESLKQLIEQGRGAPESGNADNDDVPRDEFFATAQPDS